MVSTDPDRFVEQVTRRIAEVRSELGLTQADAAERLECATKNWQRIELGQNVTLHTLARVANVLGVHPAELIPVPPRRSTKKSR